MSLITRTEKKVNHFHPSTRIKEWHWGAEENAKIQICLRKKATTCTKNDTMSLDMWISKISFNINCILRRWSQEKKTRSSCSNTSSTSNICLTITLFYWWYMYTHNIISFLPSLLKVCKLVKLEKTILISMQSVSFMYE
jgi:hypothetical protein